MFRSNWGVVAAALGVILLATFLAISLQPERPNLTGNTGYQKKGADYRAGGSDCEPKAIATLSGRKRIGRSDACSDAEEEHRLKANDLIQQRRAADAADASSIFAYQQTRIGAWGIALGIVTMFAAIGAAWFAKRAADAADKTLQHAIAVSDAEMRPYITTRAAILRKAPGEGRWKAEVKFRNGGSLPAKNTRAYLDIWILNFPVPEKLPQNTVNLINFGVVQANTEKPSIIRTPFRMTEQQVEDVKHARSAICYKLRIEYEFERHPQLDAIEREGIIVGVEQLAGGKFLVLADHYRQSLDTEPELALNATEDEGTANDGDGHPGKG